MSPKGIVIALVAASSLAHADLPPAKGPPPDSSYDVIRLYTEAAASERRGDVVAADDLRHDIRSNHDHPNALFNHARTYALLGNLKDAREMFENYLRAVPDAADAPDVTRYIAEIDKVRRPTVLAGSIHAAEIVDATILVDGEILGKSPQEMRSDGRPHRAARIGAASVATSNFIARESGELVPMQPHDGTGNVFIDIANRSGPTFTIASKPASTGRLFTLPVGRYATRLSHDEMCQPIEFDVKGGATITYVYVEDREKQMRGARCFEPVRVRVHHLVHQLYVPGKKR